MRFRQVGVRGILVMGLLAMGAGCAQRAGDGVVEVKARGASQVVPVNQVEDAAIWVHPTDATLSLLLIANKSRGLELHEPSGLLLKHYEDGSTLSGVDVVYGFTLDGKKVDLVLTGFKGALEKVAGVQVWKVDATKRRLTSLGVTGELTVLGGEQPLGVTAYASRKSGKCYFFVTSEKGKIEQYELQTGAEGKVAAAKVREMALPGKVKGSVADEETGTVYFALEKQGVWQYGAEPGDGAEGKCVIKIGEHGLLPDLTGITLYSAAGGKGYLIVVSQREKGENSTLELYERGAGHAFVTSVHAKELYGSSGIAVTNAALEKGKGEFAEGMLAVKNRVNPNGSEDYKLYSWGEIARNAGLVIDTGYSARGK